MGAELLAGDTILAACYGRVIEAARVDFTRKMSVEANTIAAARILAGMRREVMFEGPDWL